MGLFVEKRARLVKNGDRLATSAQQGTLATGVSRYEQDHRGAIVRTTLKLTNFAVATADHTTSGGSGGAKMFDFPEGVINVLGVVPNLTVAESGGLGDSATILMSIGSATAGADATLSSTEADMVPSTSVALTASAGTFAAAPSAAKILDGHATPAALYLNVAAADADSASADTVTVNGTVVITWVNLTDF